jgi:hypothetical protein
MINAKSYINIFCIIKVAEHYLSIDENDIMVEKGIKKKWSRGSCFCRNDERMIRKKMFISFNQINRFYTEGKKYIRERENWRI